MALESKIVLNAENNLFLCIFVAPSGAFGFNTNLILAMALWLSIRLFLFQEFKKSCNDKLYVIYRQGYRAINIGAKYSGSGNCLHGISRRFSDFLKYQPLCGRNNKVERLAQRSYSAIRGNVTDFNLTEAAKASPRTEIKVADPVYQSGQIVSVKCYATDATLSGSSQSRCSQRPHAKGYHLDCVRRGVYFFKG